jgi:7,8-dihydropterin-6-yl-methyl-4-(beta-D-ribofuranosyl)aminobenzene 5'-phosphate synthase
MCEDPGHLAERVAATPRAADGPAVDRIVLAPVDEVTVTALVDNTFDALLISSGDVVRPPMGTGVVAAPLFERGRTVAGNNRSGQL